MSNTTTYKPKSKRSEKRESMMTRAGRSVVASMMRRADIQSVDVEKANSGPISIGTIEIGDSTVEKVSLSKLRTIISTGKGVLDGVTSIVNLAIHVEWRVNFLIGSESDSFSLGSFDFGFDVGRLELDELSNLDFTVDEATAQGSVARVSPVSNLTFNGGEVSDISVADIRLPENGYGLSGIGFDTFTLSHIGVPDATIGQLTIGSVAPDGMLTLPLTEIEDIAVSDVDVPTLVANRPIVAPDVRASSRRITLVDIGLLRVRIRIDPTLTMRIAGFSMEELEASTTVSSVKIENIQFPLSIEGIALTDIHVQGLRANQISL